VQLADQGAGFYVTQMMRLVVNPEGRAPNFLRSADFTSNSAVAAKSGTGMVADIWFSSVTPRFERWRMRGNVPERKFRSAFQMTFAGKYCSANRCQTHSKRTAVASRAVGR